MTRRSMHFSLAAFAFIAMSGLDCMPGEVISSAAQSAQMHGSNRPWRDEGKMLKGKVELVLHRSDGKLRHRLVAATTRQLDLSGEHLVWVQGLGKLPWLTNLNLSGNAITEIDVGRLASLKRLDLSRNGISRMSGLEKLPALEVLRLASNRLQRVEGLSGLRKLRLLDLRRNPIPESEMRRVKAAFPSIRVSF